MRVQVKSRILEYVEATKIETGDGHIIVHPIDSKRSFRISTRDINFIAQTKGKPARYRISFYRYAVSQSPIEAVSAKATTVAGARFVKVQLKNPDGSLGETMYYPERAVPGENK